MKHYLSNLALLAVFMLTGMDVAAHDSQSEDSWFVFYGYDLPCSEWTVRGNRSAASDTAACTEDASNCHALFDAVGRDHSSGDGFCSVGTDWKKHPLIWDAAKHEGSGRTSSTCIVWGSYYYPWLTYDPFCADTLVAPEEDEAAEDDDGGGSDDTRALPPSAPPSSENRSTYVEHDVDSYANNGVCPHYRDQGFDLSRWGRSTREVTLWRGSPSVPCDTATIGSYGHVSMSEVHASIPPDPVEATVGDFCRAGITEEIAEEFTVSLYSSTRPSGNTPVGLGKSWAYVATVSQDRNCNSDPDVDPEKHGGCFENGVAIDYVFGYYNWINGPWACFDPQFNYKIDERLVGYQSYEAIAEDLDGGAIIKSYRDWRENGCPVPSGASYETGTTTSGCRSHDTPDSLLYDRTARPSQSDFWVDGGFFFDFEIAVEPGEYAVGYRGSDGERRMLTNLSSSALERLPGKWFSLALEDAEGQSFDCPLLHLHRRGLTVDLEWKDHTHWAHSGHQTLEARVGRTYLEDDRCIFEVDSWLHYGPEADFTGYDLTVTIPDAD